MIVPANEENLARAAALLAADGLVAFPTETVYGLGANALSEAAIRKIYAAKGRPSTSPLIVHVASLEMARSLAAAWPEAAERLARAFWPGPLTLVLPKQPHVPDALSAGLPTVGLRWPAHPVAQALIAKSGLPLAAPSANRFTQLSPTTAAHVEASLGSAVDLILDGGPSEVGIESTVLSLAGPTPVLLRPGMIDKSRLEAVIGLISDVSPAAASDGVPHAAPGLHSKHYSPRTPLYLVPEESQLPLKGRGIYLYRTKASPQILARRMPKDPDDYAALLYELLHELDSQGFAWIAVEYPPRNPEWAALWDRLQRASQPPRK